MKANDFSEISEDNIKEVISKIDEEQLAEFIKECHRRSISLNKV